MNKPFLLVAAALALAGCASPVPAPLLLTVPPVALPAAAGGAAPLAASPSTAAAPVLVLRRVGLPEYLLSRRVRYRDGASTLAEWPQAVWAERLEIGVTRELAAALRARLPGWTVCEGICADGAPGDQVLRVDFAPLDLQRGSGRLQGAAQASLAKGAVTAWTARQAIDVAATADTPQAHAAALAAALHGVAEALAPRLREGR